MGNPTTIPMLDPQGNVRDVPYDQMKTAMANGGKVGVLVRPPDGSSPRYVPTDQVPTAVQHGGTVLPYEQQDMQHPGGWHALYSDLVGLAKSAVSPKNLALNAATLGMGSTIQAIANAPETAQHYQDQKAAGYSLPYRLTTPVAESAGVNVRGMEQSAQEGDVSGVIGHAATVPVVMAATAGLAKAAPVISDVASAAVERATKAARNVTPKQAAQVVGGIGGAVTGHGPWSVPSATGGAYSLGRAAELLLGKDRANTPIFAKNPDLSLDNITDALAQTIADDRARSTVNQAKGLGNIPVTGAKGAAQTGEALATNPTPGVAKTSITSAPRFSAQDRAAAQSLLQDALKQSTADVVDNAVSPQNKAANGATKARIDSYLQSGDVAGAETVLDNAARLTKSNWTPPQRQAAPSVNEIRERVQDQAKVNSQADKLDDHAIQQQMAYDLQRHGWSAEQEARREFIARNSTGYVKTQNREFGGPSLLSDQLPGEATPKIGKAGKAQAAPSASDDLTNILQQSLEDVRRRQKGK